MDLEASCDHQLLHERDKIEHKGKTHTIVAREPRNRSLVSVNAITKDHDQIYPLYAVVLRKIAETNQEISEKNRA